MRCKEAERVDLQGGYAGGITRELGLLRAPFTTGLSPHRGAGQGQQQFPTLPLRLIGSSPLAASMPSSRLSQSASHTLCLLS